MEYDNFSVIEEEFYVRVGKIVWCTFTTIDRADRPRSRIMHPIWEGSQGWVATGRHTLKAKHIARNPWVSLCYWDPDHNQAYVDCKAEWADDAETRERVWHLYNETPPPMGYDLSTFWPDGPDHENFGVLKLTPWRIELSSLSNLNDSKVWRRKIE